MNDNNEKRTVNHPLSEAPKGVSVEMTRRQTLLSMLTLLGGGMLAQSAYADLIRNLLGGSGRSQIDRTVTPSSSVSLLAETGQVYQFRSNGLPDHATGQFPNPGCPNAIRPVPRVFQFAKVPKANTTLTPIDGWLFGVALNGVEFHPSGPNWKQDPNTGWSYEVMSAVGKPALGIDLSNAHVQPNGEYHYHGRCILLQKTLENLISSRGETRTMVLLGFAADGYPIYAPYGHLVAGDASSPIVELTSSYRLRTGADRAGGPPGPIDGSFVEDHVYVAGAGNLDEANGRFGVTPEYPQGTYYYVLTDSFHYVPRFYRGTPDPSFFHVASGTGAVVPEALKKIFG